MSPVEGNGVYRNREMWFKESEIHIWRKSEKCMLQNLRNTNDKIKEIYIVTMSPVVVSNRAIILLHCDEESDLRKHFDQKIMLSRILFAYLLQKHRYIYLSSPMSRSQIDQGQIGRQTWREPSSPKTQFESLWLHSS